MKYWTEAQNKRLMECSSAEEIAKAVKQKVIPASNTLDSLMRRLRQLKRERRITGKAPKVRSTVERRALSPEERIERERRGREEKDRRKERNEEAGVLYRKIEMLERTLAESFKIQRTPQEYIIHPKESALDEATPVIVASDWHVEETVLPEQVNSLNEYNATIATHRAKLFFQNALKLLQVSERDNAIHTVVLALLGD